MKIMVLKLSKKTNKVLKKLNCYQMRIIPFGFYKIKHIYFQILMVFIFLNEKIEISVKFQKKKKQKI